MAQVEGFEPPQDVNPLSVFKTDPFSRTWVNLHHSNGGSGRNRTSDTRIFSPLLYRLSYGTKMAVWTGLEPATSAVTGRHSKPTELPDHLCCGRRIMAQVEGFEPPQDVNPLSVFKTDPFSRTWVNLHHK